MIRKSTGKVTSLTIDLIRRFYKEVINSICSSQIPVSMRALIECSEAACYPPHCSEYIDFEFSQEKIR